MKKVLECSETEEYARVSVKKFKENIRKFLKFVIKYFPLQQNFFSFQRHPGLSCFKNIYIYTCKKKNTLQHVCKYIFDVIPKAVFDTDCFTIPYRWRLYPLFQLNSF